MAETRKSFDPKKFASFTASELQAAIGIGALAWRYTVLVPVEEMNWKGEARRAAEPELLEDLMEMLCGHFGGLTIPGFVKGWGLRDPADRSSLETNTNVPFVVYARPLALADRYFEQLQEELQSALSQGVILVERQEVFLLGPNRYSPPRTTKLLPQQT